VSRHPQPLRFGVRTHPGRRRTHNEDSFFAIPESGLFAVVDGVGGQNAGQLAASMAVKELAQRLLSPEGSREEAIRQSIALANNAIYQKAATQPELRGMACVLSVVLMEPCRLTIGHVGDTRVYKFRDNQHTLLTLDHSPVGQLLEEGSLSELEAMNHPRRNEVFRDVGGRHRTPDAPDFIDIKVVPFESDAALLLCSDGLTDLLLGHELQRIMDEEGDARSRAVALVEAALEKGGKDNVTVLVVQGPAFSSKGSRQDVELALKPRGTVAPTLESVPQSLASWVEAWGGPLDASSREVTRRLGSEGQDDTSLSDHSGSSVVPVLTEAPHHDQHSNLMMETFSAAVGIGGGAENEQPNSMIHLRLEHDEPIQKEGGGPEELKSQLSGLTRGQDAKGEENARAHHLKASSSEPERVRSDTSSANGHREVYHWPVVITLFVALVIMSVLWVQERAVVEKPSPTSLPQPERLARRVHEVGPERLTQTIREGLERAMPGDIVLVDPGEYRETVSLKSGVSLMSRVPGKAIIAPGGEAFYPAVQGLRVKDVNLMGFVIGRPGATRQVGIRLNEAMVALSDLNILGTTIAGVEVVGDSHPLLFQVKIDLSGGQQLKVDATSTVTLSEETGAPRLRVSPEEPTLR